MNMWEYINNLIETYILTKTYEHMFFGRNNEAFTDILAIRPLSTKELYYLNGIAFPLENNGIIETLDLSYVGSLAFTTLQNMADPYVDIYFGALR